MPTKKTRKKYNSWTIELAGALNKKIHGRDFDLWTIKTEYMMKSIHVYPALKIVYIYLVKL